VLLFLRVSHCYYDNNRCRQRPFHAMSKTIGYLRVSTAEQDLNKNKFAILELANEKSLGTVEWVEEKISTRIAWKQRAIASVIENATTGDNLIVSELSRLGRSMLECMEILSIASQKGINIFSVKGNWQLDGSLQSTIVAMAFAIAAQIERELISQRTKEALAARKKAGGRLGRPSGVGKSKLDPYRIEIEALLANGSTQKFVARRYGTAEPNLSRWLRKHHLKRA